MIGRIFVFLAAVVVGFCAVAVAEDTAADYRELARRVWVNESDRQPHALVQWDQKLGCVVMGVGGCTWFPAGRSGHADEVFPKLLAFGEAQGVQPPSWLRGAAPWSSAEDFAAADPALKQQMHRWLSGHLDLVGRFLVARVHAALPAMMRHSNDARLVSSRFEELASSRWGLFCLVDFMCCMGDGVAPGAQGAGLLQALEAMRPAPQAAGSSPAEFAHAAASVLQKYAQTHPARNAADAALHARRMKRCRSYSPGPGAR